jgi:hypothetical protein
MGRPWKDIGRYGGVGIEFLLTILIVSWLGHWLDGRYSLHGWGLSVGFLLGVAVAFRNLIRVAGRMQRDIERAEARDPDGSRWTVDESWVHRDEGKADEGAGPGDSGDGVDGGDSGDGR